MKTMRFWVYGALATLASFAAGMNAALAADSVCNELKASTLVLRTLPFHIYMTETQTFANSTLAKAGGQIGMGGTKQSEEISTGKSIYVLTDGKWVDMQTSLAAMEKDKDTDPDTVKEMEESKCKALPDEVMYGQQARVYFRSSPALGIETKLWVSKSTNRPVRTDTTNDSGAMKILTVSRYEYGDVRAPVGAVTMAEMVKSKGGR